MILRALALGVAIAWLPSCECSEAPSSASPIVSVEPIDAVEVAPPIEPVAKLEPTIESYAEGRRGYLYRPAGRGPFPVIVYNHGSEPEPSNFGGQARFYVPKGFVVFAPHRRGHGLSADDSVDLSRGADPNAVVDLLEAELDDVVAAVAWIRRRPDVDADRVVVAGCSFGGIESLLIAERGEGIRGAIDFAGGAILWSSSPALQERMRRAARGAKVPVLFVQAENDYDTAPSRELSATMRDAGLPTRVQIFPAHGEGPQGGHAFCGGGADPAWGALAIEFIEDVIGEPAAGTTRP